MVGSALLAGLLLARDPAAAQALSRRLDLVNDLARFDLPGRLDEVSGLAFGAGGRLFAHADERGVVYRVDPRDGSVDRGFSVGEPTVLDDFEGLAIVGERFFLVSSGGLLYEFREAAEGSSSPVRVTDTGLGRGCEVEGLAYHPGLDALLLACKTLAPPAPEIRIHRLPLDPGAPRLPAIRVPLSAFATRGHEGEVSPSALDVDPATGSLVGAAARQELLFEVDLEGRLLDVVPLSRRRHRQTEGVAFGPDGRLWMADEGAGHGARLTVYGPPREAPG